MPDIRRFVTYLYYYENNNKMQIAGFAKIEIRGGQCRLDLHINAPGITARSIPVYLFAREGKIIQAVEIGQMNIMQNVRECRIMLPSGAIGQSSYTIQDMKGLLLPLDDRTMYASQWDEEPITREQIQIYKPQLPEEDSPKQLEEDTAKQPELHTAEIAMDKIMPIHDMPQPGSVKEQLSEAKENQSLWEYWEAIKQKMTVIHPIEDKGIACVHMELRDIRELPKRYWYLGNNSFLLHGFFNYRYLLLGERVNEESRELFIGIPGVYQNQEKVMAAIFGFPVFLTEKETDSKEDKFGYWCHFMSE